MSETRKHNAKKTFEIPIQKRPTTHCFISLARLSLPHPLPPDLRYSLNVEENNLVTFKSMHKINRRLKIRVHDHCRSGIFHSRHAFPLQIVDNTIQHMG